MVEEVPAVAAVGVPTEKMPEEALGLSRVLSFIPKPCLISPKP